NYFGARLYLGDAYTQKGFYAEAISELKKATELSASGDARASLGYAYAVSGRRSEAQRILAELQEQSKLRQVNPIHIAKIHAGLGEKDLALDWLEKAFQDRAP